MTLWTCLVRGSLISILYTKRASVVHIFILDFLLTPFLAQLRFFVSIALLFHYGLPIGLFLVPLMSLKKIKRVFCVPLSLYWSIILFTVLFYVILCSIIFAKRHKNSRRTFINEFSIKHEYQVLLLSEIPLSELNSHLIVANFYVIWWTLVSFSILQNHHIFISTMTPLIWYSSNAQRKAIENPWWKKGWTYAECRLC